MATKPLELGLDGDAETMTPEDERRRRTLQTTCQALKSYFTSLESQMTLDIERFQHMIDISAVETSTEIDLQANKLISDFTKAVRIDMLNKKSELERCRKSTNNEIRRSFSEVKSLVDKGTSSAGHAEERFQCGSLEDIEESVKKVTQVKKTLTEYLASTSFEVPNMKFTLIQSKKANGKTFYPSVGRISVPDVKALCHKQTTPLDVSGLQTAPPDKAESAMTHTGKKRASLETSKPYSEMNLRTEKFDKRKTSLETSKRNADRQRTPEVQTSNSIPYRENSSTNGKSNRRRLPLDVTTSVPDSDTTSSNQKFDRRRTPSETSESDLALRKDHKTKYRTSKSASDKVVNTQTSKKYSKQRIPFDTSKCEEDEDEPVLPLTNRKLSKLRLETSFNVKTQSDMHDSRLMSILVLKNKGLVKIVVTDCSNQCLKLFCSTSTTLLSVCSVTGQPCGLARSRDRVLVTLPFKRQILFVNVQDEMRVTESLNTDKQYYYIAVLPDNTLALTTDLTEDGCVDILSPRGHFVRSISNNIIPYPRSLTAKGDSLVVVSDSRATLTCVTPSRIVLWMAEDSAMLKDLANITADVFEFVYVCDKARGAIVQLTPDGEVVRDIITRNDGLSGPEAISCFHDKLYVAERFGEIKIFQWT
ncbi:uncharacterized protein LOC121387811 [Gigantopelta aegis]|uniref:uncharacterized protein LOC121387811 n=1 Tax=Gigantopelta aegis TaxID=1735272 RepID=UPI001B887496|nr:uncharacterized protein LOC121387811 [Gigantopelta aegis]